MAGVLSKSLTNTSDDITEKALLRATESLDWTTASKPGREDLIKLQHGFCKDKVTSLG
jgi:hypothetical protein